MGAVSRINPGGTSAGGTVGTTVGEVSALDLIYTTRYGAVPLLHWRGGHLSICQWSRILTIASLRGTTALQAPDTPASSISGLARRPSRRTAPVVQAMAGRS